MYNPFHLIVHYLSCVSHCSSGVDLFITSEVKRLYSICFIWCYNSLYGQKMDLIISLQVPISELRNDARDNILGALILAGQYIIPEVRGFQCSLI